MLILVIADPNLGRGNTNHGQKKKKVIAKEIEILFALCKAK